MKKGIRPLVRSPIFGPEVKPVGEIIGWSWERVERGYLLCFTVEIQDGAWDQVVSKIALPQFHAQFDHDGDLYCWTVNTSSPDARSAANKLALMFEDTLKRSSVGVSAA